MHGMHLENQEWNVAVLYGWTGGATDSEANGVKETPHKKSSAEVEIAARDQDKEEEEAMRNDPDAVRRRVAVRNLVITGKSGGV